MHLAIIWQAFTIWAIKNKRCTRCGLIFGPGRGKCTPANSRCAWVSQHAHAQMNPVVVRSSCPFFFSVSISVLIWQQAAAGASLVLNMASSDDFVEPSCWQVEVRSQGWFSVYLRYHSLFMFLCILLYRWIQYSSTWIFLKLFVTSLSRKR